MKTSMKTSSSHQVLAFQVIDKETALLAVRMTKNNQRAELKKLESKLNGFSVLAGSAVKLPYSSIIHDLFRVTIARKMETKPATDGEKARMTVLSSNMFMSADDEASVWEQRGDVLVRKHNVESADHLQQILTASVCPAEVQMTRDSHNVRSVLASSVPKVAGGMYAVFTVASQIMDGYVVATYDDGDALLLPRPDDNKNPYAEVTVKADNIIAAFDLKDFESDIGAVPVAQKELEAMVLSSAAPTASQALAYYKKVYGYNAEYFRKFSAMLRERGFYS